MGVGGRDQGPRPLSEGRRGLVQGTSQALEECERPERMKEGRNGVRCRRPRQEAGGGAPRLQRPERSWGQRESGGVSASAGRGAPRPGGREAGRREAALLAERRGRREAPDGLRAPPAGCGGSRSQRGARAQTSGRQRTPASGPQSPRGERGAGGRGLQTPPRGAGPRGQRLRPVGRAAAGREPLSPGPAGGRGERGDRSAERRLRRFRVQPGRGAEVVGVRGDAAGEMGTNGGLSRTPTAGEGFPGLPDGAPLLVTQA